MTINAFFITIIIAVSLKFIFDWVTDYLTLRSLNPELPDKLTGIYDPETYRRSQEYTRANIKLGWVSGTLSLVLLLAFWLSGGISYLDGAINSWTANHIARGLLFIVILFAAYEIISLPFSIYETFVIEERFGFNRTTVRLFINDMVKVLVLSALIGLPLLTGVYAIFHYLGAFAWLYCWIVLTVYSLVMQIISPIWIMPWFNKFKPVESTELRDAVLNYADSVNYRISDVYIVDESKRSTKPNAFFTGIGRSKRIALYDTLVENYTVPEIVAILGHEIGHFKKKHILMGLGIGIIHSGIMLFLLSLFLTSPGLYDAFGVQQSVYLGILFFGLLFIPLEWLLSIVTNIVSRRNEYASDRFAATTIPEPQSSITALKKLASTNLANLTTHPLDIFVNYSHPPLLDRVNAIEKITMK